MRGRRNDAAETPPHASADHQRPSVRRKSDGRDRDGAGDLGAADHPIDQACDHRRRPSGSRWVAAAPGEQRLILAFDTPQTIRTISLEVEEPEVSRTQVLHVSVSSDGGQTYQELRRQEYTFSPPGTTFEREEWALTVEGVTHLQMVITPDKGGYPGRATLTSLVVL
jgi:hypothetical protein